MSVDEGVRRLSQPSSGALVCCACADRLDGRLLAHLEAIWRELGEGIIGDATEAWIADERDTSGLRRALREQVIA